MFSTIASILFVPSDTVLKSVQAVKKTNFNSGPVIGANQFLTSTPFNFISHFPGLQPERLVPCSLIIRTGLQLRRQMREGRDKVGARTSDSHGETRFGSGYCPILRLHFFSGAIPRYCR
jgi:hypothetical protein